MHYFSPYDHVFLAFLVLLGGGCLLAIIVIGALVLFKNVMEMWQETYAEFGPKRRVELIEQDVLDPLAQDSRW